MRNVLKNMQQAAVLTILFGGFSALSFAQSTAFTGFTSVHLVLTRFVYSGTASTVIAGQALPPACPATAACGTAVATDNDAGPSTTGTNNVWNNNKVDGSFGVTSPIFIDQLTPTNPAGGSYYRLPSSKREHPL
jgi:hypothetical protein